jgi:hypothetical protein
MVLLTSAKTRMPICASRLSTQANIFFDVETSLRPKLLPKNHLRKRVQDSSLVVFGSFGLALHL